MYIWNVTVLACFCGRVCAGGDGKHRKYWEMEKIKCCGVVGWVGGVEGLLQNGVKKEKAKKEDGAMEEKMCRMSRERGNVKIGE